jgi:hypothetical protein
MSRRIAALVALVVVCFVLGASACSNASNATGPAPIRADGTCTNWASNGTCLH